MDFWSLFVGHAQVFGGMTLAGTSLLILVDSVQNRRSQSARRSLNQPARASQRSLGSTPLQQTACTHPARSFSQLL